MGGGLHTTSLYPYLTLIGALQVTNQIPDSIIWVWHHITSTNCLLLLSVKKEKRFVIQFISFDLIILLWHWGYNNKKTWLKKDATSNVRTFLTKWNKRTQFIYISTNHLHTFPTSCMNRLIRFLRVGVCSRKLCLVLSETKKYCEHEHVRRHLVAIT